MYLLPLHNVIGERFFFILYLTRIYKSLLAATILHPAFLFSASLRLKKMNLEAEDVFGEKKYGKVTASA